MDTERSSFITRHASGFVQICVWTFLLSLPMLFIMEGYGSALDLIIDWMLPIGIMMAVFYLNYWLFVPKLFFRNRKEWFFVANIFLELVMVVFTISLWVIFSDSHVVLYEILFELTIFSLLMIATFSMFVFVALALRSMQRNKQLEHIQLLQKEEFSRIESEQLKAQLNPHFIFNSLNNISALVDISPEHARQAISRLSFMMRYVLEQGANQFVPLNSELDFIQDYIDLMRLRYTDNLKIEVNFPSKEKAEAVNVPPMIFISLVENAFKHGASSNIKSHIVVSLHLGKCVVFSVENSLLPISRTAKTPSHGVGLQNLSKRLDIIYPRCHTFSCATDKEKNLYKAEIAIPRNNSDFSS